MFLVVWKHAKMQQNTFSTTPDVKKYFFCGWSGSMRKCIKTRFQPLLTLKSIFFKDMFLVVWKHAKMHQNTFSTTPDVKNDFFSGGLEACANASKRFFNHSSR
jgi:hypothetical protein